MGIALRWLLIVVWLAAPVRAGADATPCLPPGIPALSTLVRMGGHGRTVLARSESIGDEVIWQQVGAWTSYWGPAPGFAVQYMLIAIGGEIAVVDDHPYDQDPAWYDTGMVSSDGDYVHRGSPTCQWKRFPARGARPQGPQPKT